MKQCVKSILITSLVLCCTCLPVWAVVTPQSSHFDQRIQMITYNANDVVKLYGVLGVATQIILEPDETYTAHAFGDPQAWTLTHVDNHIFLKPKAENGDTNLIIVTNKRSYNFELHYVAKATPQTTFQLSFRYPEEMTAQLKVAQNNRQLVSAFQQHAGPINLDYRMTRDRVSRAIAPTHVWDDGRFTYFQFPGNRDLPTIYVVNSDGSEAIVNRFNQGTDNNTIVLEKIAPQWVVRLNKQVVGIVNKQFDAEGIANGTGTMSPAVSRVVNRSAP